jgi:peptidoglycan hydrolase-like protein with peptidoglycan-binding domain
MGARQRLAAAALITVGAVLVPGAGVTTAAQASAGSGVHLPAHLRHDLAGVGVPSAAGTFAAPQTTLRLGAKGAAVKLLQTRLKALGYVPGTIDARYGGATQSAVWAFQKVQGLTPTSTVSARTWRALEDPKAPKVLVPDGKPDRVEVNLTKQIMVLYRGGEVKLVSHMSSGSGIPYTEYADWNGKRQKFSGDARTPTGDFKTTWRDTGWHKSYLGQLYNPIFFNGGIALHGALSVPLFPASHGCVRLPMHVARILPKLLGKGVPVHVKGAFKR